MKVSYCILTYNQERYIQETLKSAFEQTYSPMEIVISDDNSTDRTFEIIQKFAAEYKGPNSIIINRNIQNLGLREHYNKVLYELSHGDIVILADGDDYSVPTRVEEYVRTFERFPEVVMVSSNSIETDEYLSPLNENNERDGAISINTINDYISNGSWFIHSSDSRGIRRNVIDSFPPLKYPFAEDLSFFLRALLVGSECYINEGYVYRRHHECNTSSRKWEKETIDKLKQQMQEDVNYAIDRKYISEAKAKDVKNKYLYSLKYWSIYSPSEINPVRSLFYRFLSKIFKVRLFRI